ncbi:MAG: murein biosynthesis integral membrane protein MurJ [bacterium]|nr:murein biosynthesis integral membrane protein MurJ [bacterium]
MKKYPQILSAATIIMLMMLASRILGIVRERLLVSIFDRTLESDVYRASFLIPDTLFDIFIFGALSVSFIPVFTSYLSNDQKESAFRYANSLLSVFLCAFLVVALVLGIVAPSLAHLLLVGYVGDYPETPVLFGNLTRLLLLAQVFFVLSAFLTGILHSFQRFFLPAVASVVYNVAIILGIVLFSSEFGIYGPALGVVMGAFFHLLIQIPLVWRLGFRYEFLWNITDPGFRETLRLMIPRVVTAIMMRFADVVMVPIASLVAIGSYTVYNIAFILQGVPVGLFGLSIAQAALPSLSSAYAKKDMGMFQDIVVHGIRQILFFIVPVAAMLIALRIPITRLVYGAKTFPWEATVLTGQTLSLFSVSLFAQALVLLFSRCFYAMHNPITPLKIIGFSTLTTVVASFALVFWFGWNVDGLALAFSLGSIVNASLLFIALDRVLGGFDYQKLIGPTLKIAVAGSMMAFGLRILMKQLDLVVFDTTRTINLIYLTASVSIVGLGIYLLLVWILRVEELREFLALFRRLTGWRKTLRLTEELIEPQQK